MTQPAETAVAGFDVSRETFAALRSFESLVRKWTPAINLVSKSSVNTLWDRHVVDSAQVFSVVPTESVKRWVDLGSGGGFPGLVVAILAKELRPALRVTLVEADLRKAAFLQQAAHALSLNVEVLRSRIESLAPLNADVLSARALAPLAQLLEFAEKHLSENGTAVFPKGARFSDEIADARKVWSFDIDTQSSVSDSDASILLIRNIHRA
ncbi:16S rRNA (guanine(527)-N(7))-methyltransferase RsmG [Phormidesmis sp. 146-33]